ncbi:MAG: hypothetical protein ACRCYT_05350 [Cetobacterium sp.]
MKKILAVILTILSLTGCSGWSVYENPNPKDLRDNLKGWKVQHTKDQFKQPTNKVVAIYPLNKSKQESKFEVHRNYKNNYGIFIDTGLNLGAIVQEHTYNKPITSTEKTNVYDDLGTKIGEVESESTSYVTEHYTTITIDVRIVFPDGLTMTAKAYSRGGNRYEIDLNKELINKMLESKSMQIYAVGSHKIVTEWTIDLTDFKNAHDRIGYFNN